ncbi:hypothetical protein V5O48_012391 [Marasmius crinis-equi]|uniref:GH18 domain-containing protein n=1 Tax=Marasmius crinis-equi TaxID=585013 RepID=A0ABR3F2W8_9AGAR
MRSTAFVLLVSLAVSLPSQVFCETPRVSQAWFPGWHSKEFTPFNVSWHKYTHMTYAFAIPSSDIKSLHLEKSEQSDLSTFVTAAKANNVKAIVSIGGWTGSIYWSSAVGSPQNRTTFIKTVTDFATQNKLDGLDFDWEYPNRQGLGCNVINPNDTSNFISFLEELRQHPVGKHLILTAATSITPYNDATGSPSSDLSRFANALDFVALMNYDIWGPWSATVGPNAPLNDTCVADTAKQQGSAVSAVTAWKKAGVPIEKMLLGLPAYGHSFKVKKEDAFKQGSSKELAEYPKMDKSVRPAGDRWDDPAGLVDACGVSNPAGGIYNFWGLVENGFLGPDGKPKYPSRFDECSKGAFVYNPDTEIMVSYDSTQSWAAKGKYIKDTGLAGFAIWEAGGDYKDMLIDSVRKAAGM